MIYGFIPWNDLWQEGFGKDFPLPTFADFYFPEAAGALPRDGRRDRPDREARRGGDGDDDRRRRGRLPRRGADHRLRARDHGRDEERLHDRHDPALDGERRVGPLGGAFAILAFIVNLPIAFLVPSSSGHAALVMPILAPLADFAGVSRAIVVTAFQSASGLVNLVTPTSAVIMGGLALSKVGYDRYLKFVWPYLGRRLRRLLRLHRDRRRPRVERERRARMSTATEHRARDEFRGRDAEDGDRPPAGPGARAAVAVELPRAALRRRDLGPARAAGARRVRRPDARARRRGAALPRPAGRDARGRRGARVAALAAAAAGGGDGDVRRAS